MNDLEICSRIARIEGVGYRVQNNKVLPEAPAETNMSQTTDVYNPLKDKSLLLDLIFKHEVEIGFDAEGVGMKNHDKTKWIGADFSGKENLPRAILELIIEAHKC